MIKIGLDVILAAFASLVFVVGIVVSIRGMKIGKIFILASAVLFAALNTLCFQYNSSVGFHTFGLAGVALSSIFFGFLRNRNE